MDEGDQKSGYTLRRIWQYRLNKIRRHLTGFHKIENNFIFEMRKKKIWANFQRVQNFLPKKLSLSSQKYGFGIRKKSIQDPGVKKAPDPGSGTLHGQNLSSTSDCCAAIPASG
jgi:hypothetical protein